MSHLRNGGYEPGRAAPQHRVTWLVPVAILFGVFAVYAATAAREAISIDAHAASVEAWKLGSSGSAWLTPHDLRALPHDQWLSRAPNGHIVAQRMAGPIIAGIPFYWLLGAPADPSNFSLLPAGIAASAFTAGTVVLVFLALRRHAPADLAVSGALVFALATPTWSVSADGLWTHTVTQLGIAGAAWALSAGRWWVAGTFLGVGMLGRPHVAVIAATVGLGLAWTRRDTRLLIRLGLPTLSALGALMLWNRWMFGAWSIGGSYGDGRVAQAAEGYGSGGLQQLLNYLGFFVSANKGLFVWSPVLLLLIPAVCRSWRDLPDWSRWLLVGGLVYTFFQLRLNYFAGGDTFYGYRHGLELLTCVTPAFTFAAPASGRFCRTLLPPTVALQFAAILVGAVSEGFFLTVDKAWTHNGFVLALQTQPAVVGSWTGLCVILGVAASIMLGRRRTRVSTGDLLHA